MRMRSYTVDTVVSLRPCEDYPRERVVELWAGREALNAIEIGQLDIPAADRLWALVGLLGDARQRRLWACDIVENMLEIRWGTICGQARGIIEVARRAARGEASAEELAEAKAEAWGYIRDACGSDDSPVWDAIWGLCQPESDLAAIVASGSVADILGDRAVAGHVKSLAALFARETA